MEESHPLHLPEELEPLVEAAAVAELSFVGVEQPHGEEMAVQKRLAREIGWGHARNVLKQEWKGAYGLGEPSRMWKPVWRASSDCVVAILLSNAVFA